VASLLRRIDAISPVPARRVRLSATIGDLNRAGAWLRPSDPANVEILVAKSDAPVLRLHVRGYREPPDLDDQDRAEVEEPVPGRANRVALDNSPTTCSRH
jgi:ATP-dependent Lhr-like helicase